MSAASGADEVLFFVPDMGGFTRFVTQTEMRHSQHLIAELLEVLVDAGAPDLQVAEIEGDAVLFFRLGPPPSLDWLVERAGRLFVAFHAHLKRFEQMRICHCGACAGAGAIRLKMVAHAGTAATMRVKDQVKFIGRDIIVVHRLLKNSVRDEQYLLVTRQTLRPGGDEEVDGAPIRDGSDRYDEIGDVAYRSMSLEPLLEGVRVEPPESIALRDPRRRLSLSRRIPAPMRDVYQRLIDLPARQGWMDGVTEVEQDDDSPNHLGKVHRCVRGDEGTPVITTDARVGDDRCELWETDTRRIAACRYLLTPAGERATDLTIEFYTRGNPLVGLFFHAVLARRLRANFERSLAQLARSFSAG